MKEGPHSELVDFLYELGDITSAIHQAGHLMIAFLLNRELYKIQLFLDPPGRPLWINSTRTATSLDKMAASDQLTPDELREIDGSIQSTLAGLVAECLYHGEVPDDVWYFEAEIGWALDTLRIRKPDAQTKDLSAFLSDLVETLSTPEIWGAVLDLREGFRENFNLKHDEVVQIIQKCARVESPSKKVVLTL